MDRILAVSKIAIVAIRAIQLTSMRVTSEAQDHELAAYNQCVKLKLPGLKGSG